MADETGAVSGAGRAGRGGRIGGPGAVAAPAVQVLGGFELRIGERAVPLAANGRRVLACLALGGPAMRRDVLAGRVWAWSSEGRAQANLRNALWRIRQVDRRVVEADNDEVRLGGDVAVDLRASAAHARWLVERSSSCGTGTGVATAVTATAPDLLEADILPDWGDDWVLLERERHRQLRIHGLEALSRCLAQAGRFAEAVDAAYAAITAEPLRESAYAALIRAHLAEGNRAEAARQFAAYRRVVNDELGLPPSPAIAALLEPVLNARG
jgi:DNA-binding SARP family transcriptional activator